MRKRSLGYVLVAVVVAHGLVIGGPWYPGFSWWPDAKQARARLETVWVQPVVPAPQPPAAVLPPPAPRPARPAKKAMLPSPPPVEAPAPVAPQAPSAPVAQTPEVAAAIDPAEPAEAAPVGAEPLSLPAGPRLQVQDAGGAPVSLVLDASEPALHAQMALRFQVHGFVKGMEYHAQATMEWQVAAGHYHARQSVSAFLLGSLEQTSEGTWGAQGLQPLRFTERRFAKRRAVDFDWAAGEAVFTPARPPAAIGPGAQDRLSVFLQLAAMLQSMPALRAPGTRLAIPTLGSRSLQIWTFVVEGTDTVEVPAGRFEALRLRRQPKAGEDEQALLWLLPRQGYAPLRIQLQEGNGDVLDFALQP